MKIGDTFLGALPGETRHLWVVITTPNDQNEVVIVNLTSRPCDETCRIQAGEHPFVKKPTVVRYQDARLCSISLLEIACKKNLFLAHQPVSEDLLRRIQEGALKSEFTPGKVVREVRRVIPDQG